MSTPRKPALIFIFITLVVDILGIGLIIPILPKLVLEFRRTPALESSIVTASNPEAAEHFGILVAKASDSVGLLAASYALMQFLCAPLLGSLSDRFGRRPVILISLLGSGLDYFLLASAPNLGWFFVGRLIAGITGANFSAATAYIADISPPEKRAANFGMIGAAFGLGFILGPVLGGLLGDVNVRLPFVVAGGLTLLNTLYGWLVLPESLAPENRRAFSWSRSNPVGALLALRRYPMVLGLAGTYFLIHVAHQVLPGTWVLYTTYRYGWTPKETGWSLALVGLMAALVQGGLTRVFVGRIGESATAACGLAIAVLTFIAYGMAPLGWMMYVIIVFGSLGGVTGPSVQGLISRTVGADEQGGVQGALTSLTSVAGIIGTPVAAALFGHFIRPSAKVHLPGAAFYFSALLMVLALLLALRSFRRARQKGAPHSS